jgi:hypothetical protein
VCVQQELLSPPRSAREKISRHATLAAASLAKNSQGVAATVEQERSNKTHTHTHGKMFVFLFNFFIFFVEKQFGVPTSFGASGRDKSRPASFYFIFFSALDFRVVKMAYIIRETRP